MKPTFDAWWKAHRLSKVDHTLTSGLERLAREAWEASAKSLEASRSRKDGDFMLHLLEQLISAQSSRHDILLCHDYEDGYWIRLVEKGYGHGIPLDRTPGRLRLSLAEAVREALRYDDREWKRIFQEPRYDPKYTEEELLGECPTCQSPLKEGVKFCEECHDDHHFIHCEKCGYTVQLSSFHNKCCQPR